MKDFTCQAKQELGNQRHSENLRTKRLDLAFGKVILTTIWRWSRERPMVERQKPSQDVIRSDPEVTNSNS